MSVNAMTQGREPLLSVEGLRVSLAAADKRELVAGVSFRLVQQSVTAIVGQSGSGKSLTARAIMGLLDRQIFIVEGQVIFDGREIVGSPACASEEFRGVGIGLVFQDPGTHLNPLMTIRSHLAEAIVVNRCLPAGMPVDDRIHDLLRRMQFEAPERIARSYPHQLSGGQKQRAMIAMALASEPRLLIADEPTSALDATVQMEIMTLLLGMKEDYALTLLLITHDIGMAMACADQILVMDRGAIIERSTPADLLRGSEDPRTQRLLAARDRLPEIAPLLKDRAMPQDTILEVQDLSKNYATRGAWGKAREHEALQPISLSLHRGETLAIVGESGSGKTTIARLLVSLIEPSGGSMRRHSSDVALNARRGRNKRDTSIQLVFQDPSSALDPTRSVSDLLLEPMRLHGIGSSEIERLERAAAALERVGLDRDALSRRPGAFSGGERQRIAIARCLTLDPQILICDECVSALDSHLQVQILALLAELRHTLGIAYIFISHDMQLVRHFSDRVIILSNGKVVEEGVTHEVFARPQHPVTQGLIAAQYLIPAVV